MNTKINPRKGIFSLIALVALSAMLVLPAASFGQTLDGGDCSPPDAQYAQPNDILNCAPAIAFSGDDSVDGDDGSGSELPFTGFDALTLLAVAAALTGTGLVLRRATSTGAERS